MGVPPDQIAFLDAVACFVLVPLTVWILLSGLDDLIVDAAAFMASWQHSWGKRPSRRSMLQAPQRKLAIFIPCWHEHNVITHMVERNLAQVRYDNYTFFIGVYPNDRETFTAVRRLADRFPRVRLALCPHDGPTSKADCLNWIYQRMLLAESEEGDRYDVVITHDAEDVIHPDAFGWISWYAADYDMIQIPVLPLPTPVTHWTHGVYCDEFAEYQARDMQAREFMNAFVPSNGVGTGFRRDALDALACAAANRIFEPVCLTEDYENGLRLKLRNAKQLFVRSGSAITREYFPQTFRTAVRQKTRWVTGIALQTWERHGWTGSLACRYWLWRDRKGLVSNPAGLLSNLLFAYGLITLALSEWNGYRWGMLDAVQTMAPFLTANALLGTYRMIYRAVCVGVHYGTAFMLTVPIRAIWGNAINSTATVRAMWRYFCSKWNGEPLRWLKTEHEYPNAAAFFPEHLSFDELLVRNGYIERSVLERVLRSKPINIHSGEYLFNLGLIDAETLEEATLLQSGASPPEQRAA